MTSSVMTRKSAAVCLSQKLLEIAQRSIGRMYGP